MTKNKITTSFPSSCLGTPCREALLRGHGMQDLVTMQSSTTKRSFLAVRSQAELGNEEGIAASLGILWISSTEGSRPPLARERAQVERLTSRRAGVCEMK